MTPSTISVLGCGWLGFPLAIALRQSGYALNGSVISQDKFPALQQAGIAPYLLHSQPPINGSRIREFFDANVLVVTIPFKRDLPDPTVYFRQLDAVVEQMDNAKTAFVIFTSSTSIYPDSMADAIEEAEFLPDNPRAQVLWDIEESLLSSQSFDATIVRLAGLYGPDRPIGKFLAGKRGLDDADRPVNLIHRDDAVAVIQKIIMQDIRGEVFNACSDGHPSRRDLYTKAAIRMNLPPPVFTHSPGGRCKVVNNRKIKERLNYQFQHPDPMDL